jgi:hypothetical protein
MILGFTTTSNGKLKNATIKLFVEWFRRMREGRCGDSPELAR